MFEDLSVAVDSADLLVSHPVTFAAPVVAQVRKLKWASAVLAPMSFFSRHDYPVFPPAPWLKSLQRFGDWPGRLLVGIAKSATRRWQEPVFALRRRLGLPRGGDPMFEGQHAPDLVLALFSRTLCDPQPDWPPNVIVTGHVFHDAPHGESLSPEIESFLDAGPAPVVFTLGSSAVMVPGDFWRESIAAVRSTGARAVLLMGPGNAAALRPSLPPEILAVDVAPHSQLFPRATAVVQQCGIGYDGPEPSQRAADAGVPHAHDQPDNAWRAARLGMARVVYPRRYRAARVAEELRMLRDDVSYGRPQSAPRPSYGTKEGHPLPVMRSERTFGLAC